MFFDSSKQRAVGANQRPKRGAAFGIHHVNERRALRIEPSRAIDFKSEQVAKRGRQRAMQIFGAATEPS